MVRNKFNNLTKSQIETILKNMDGWQYRKCLNKLYEKNSSKPGDAGFVYDLEENLEPACKVKTSAI